jgi:hypothetical protein
MVAACDAYDEAVQAYSEATGDGEGLDTHAEIAAVRAAAPLIVASELQRLAEDCEPPTADEIGDYDDAEEHEREGVRSMCIRLRQLAAELRGGAQ